MFKYIIQDNNCIISIIIKTTIYYLYCFNTTCAKELQLGFLKLLRGTSLRNDANEYGYIYQKESPYEMIENKWLSQTDVHNIHIAEDMLEKYWNSGRFVRTMNAVMDEQDRKSVV